MTNRQVSGFRFLGFRGERVTGALSPAPVQTLDAGSIAYFATEIEEPADNGHVIGVDMNVSQVADSDGELHHAPDMKRLEARARRKRGSRRREKALRRLARVRRKIANRRRNWHHHVSRKLAARAGTIVVEDLNTGGMTRSAKGTVDEPGRNVAQKAGLNRGILATGWASLRRMLEYKAARVVSVPARHTSQTCHECGAVDSRSRNSRAEFTCVACGHAANADLNAAANILASGIGASARRGAFASATPATREIDAMAA